LKQSTLPGKTTEENLEDISKQFKDLTGIFRSIRGMNSFLIETPSEYETRLQAIRDRRKEIPRWKIIVRNLLVKMLDKISK